MMELKDNYRYYVVQLLQQPYDDIDEFVCVPESWVKSSKEIKQRTCVVYPSEKSIDTKEKVKKRRKEETEWKTYSAVVNYSTDSYRDALSYISAKTGVPQKRASSKTRSKCDTTTIARKRKSRLLKQKALSTAKIIKYQPREAQIKNDQVAPIKLFLKRPDSVGLLKGERSRNQPTIIQEPKSTIKISNFNNKPVESLGDYELRSILEESSVMDSRSQEITIEASTVVNDVDAKTCSQSSTKNGTSATRANTFLESLGLTSRANLSSSQDKALPEIVIEKKAEVQGMDQNPRPGSSTENKISTGPTSSVTANEPCQLEHSNSKTPSPVQERQVSETFNGKHNGVNEINQSACLTISTGNTTTAQNSTRSVSQSGESSKYFHENQSSRNYRDTSNLDPQVKELLAQNSVEVTLKTESVCLPRNIMTPAAMQNSPHVIIQSNRPLEQPHRHYPSSNLKDHSHIDRRMQELLARGSAGTSSSGERAYPQRHTKNMTPDMLSYPNSVNPFWHTSGSAQKMQLITANTPCLYQDPNERHISIQKSIEANVHDQRACSQHIPQNTSAMQPFENMVNQYSHLPAHAQVIQPAAVNRNYVHQDPQQQKTLNRRSAEVNYIDQRVCSQDVKNNAPSTLQKSANLNNHISQLSGYSQGKRHPTVHKDFLKQDLSRSAVITSESTGMANMAGISKEIPHQSIKQNAPAAQGLPSVTNHLYQSACPQDLPLEKNHVRTTTERNLMDLRANFPANTENTPYLMQLTNQFGQSFERSNEAPFPPINGNSLLQDSRLQQILYNSLTEMNSANQRAFPLSISRNIPSAPNSSNVAKRSGCSCNYSNEQRSSTITANDFQQNLRVQETPVAGSTEGNCTKQNSYQSSTEERSPATESSFNIVNQSSEYAMEEVPSPIHVSSSDQVMSAEEILAKKMNDAYDTGRSTSETATQSSPDAIDHISSDFYATTPLFVLKQCNMMFKKMKLCVAKNIELFDLERAALVNYDAKLEKLIETLNQCCLLKNDHAVASTSKDTTRKSKQVTDKKQNKKNIVEKYNLDDDDDEDDDNDDSGDDVEDNNAADSSGDDDNSNGNPNRRGRPNKKRNRTQSFSLPPEYNPKNSRWTLKFPRATTGIIEVRSRTRVYIDAIKFAHCKRMSRDYKTFARMLLVEIFSQNALSVCSLTGARANAFTIDERNVRPGLDENARTVLLEYVEEYGRERGWGPFDSQSVLNSIRSKIQEIRSKNNLTS